MVSRIRIKDRFENWWSAITFKLYGCRRDADYTNVGTYTAFTCYEAGYEQGMKDGQTCDDPKDEHDT